MSKKDNLAISDFNLQKLQTKELSKHVSATIHLNGNIAIFGMRGTGKTAIAKQEIAKSGMHEVYINLSVLERVDMGGYPDIMGQQNVEGSRKKKFIDFLLPEFYEPMLTGNKPVVALLDEVDKADPSLWAPLLEFTQFKSINGKTLPNLKSIIMTGNLISEGGSRPSLPLLDRAEKYLVEADATSWLNWAGSDGHIHPSITAYINDNPKHLFGAADAEDRYADPSPRGWHKASDILYAGEQRGWDPDLLNKKVCGCVGKEVGIHYSNYFEHYQKLIPLINALYSGEDISKEYNDLEPAKKLICCMFVCARFANQLDELQTLTPPKSASYVAKFLQNVTYENVLIAVRSQIQLQRIIKFGLDEFPVWSSLIKDIAASVS